MDVTIRPYQNGDALQMTEILNEIIAIGGTTAYLTPLSVDEMERKISGGGARARWNIAVDETGRIIGFQWAEPYPTLPPEAVSIATFVRVGVVGSGIGSRLFAQTREQMRAQGFAWINASIRSDNVSGLSYYSKMGFSDWKIEPDATLMDGTRTGKTHKRYDLG